LELRRGLSVILGDVGTGKTTLSRKLAQVICEKDNVDFHMILNPYFKTEKQFLSRLARLFHTSVSKTASAIDLMEAIERTLFTRGVEEDRTVVLLLDEAQILPNFVLEILRILLNYETNEYKILQLILVGQLELLPRISMMSNFWDRIALKYVINPFDEEEVREVIEYRLQQAGYQGEEPLFSDAAIRMITEHSQGYPRKVALLCHNALEYLVMYEKSIVDEQTILRVLQQEIKPFLASQA
jgi:general secretion pathway protein A